MKKNILIESARNIVASAVFSSAVWEKNLNAHAAELNAILSRREDLEELIGPGNSSVMEMNHANHFRYMISVAALFDPKSFVETVLWVFRTYRARGFSVRYWEVMLPEARGILYRHMGDDYLRELGPYYEWLLANIPAFADLSETELSAFEDLGKA
jgi:hypothetical protein